MTQHTTPDAFLENCTVDPEIYTLQPDYRALLLVVTGLDSNALAATATAADGVILDAERHAARLLAESPVEDLPHVAAWRDAYRSFGAKPQRTRNSLEALTRRASSGLPRVNALTDVYNAISVLHQVPIGGEDFERYTGAARLSRALGDEPFDTVAAGDPVTEYPEVGEVVWGDDAGVTCRRWNWRQGRRTALTAATSTALFIVDALAPMSDEALANAGETLSALLTQHGANVSVHTRLLRAQS